MDLKLFSLFLLLFISSCIDRSKVKKTPTTINAQSVYSEHCSICHGDDGKRGLSGAKDLSATLLSRQELRKIIEIGKGGMAGYKHVLSSNEIDSVIHHISTLKPQ